MADHVLAVTTTCSCNSQGLDALNSMSMLADAHHHAETGSHSAFCFGSSVPSDSKAIEPEQDCTIVLVHHTPKGDHADEKPNICECVGNREGQIRAGHLELGL